MKPWLREKARREALAIAVWELRRKGFTWRAIADAVKRTKWQVSSIWYRERRKRLDADTLCQHDYHHKSTRDLLRRILTCQKCKRTEQLKSGKWIVIHEGNLPETPIA